MRWWCGSYSLSGRHLCIICRLWLLYGLPCRLLLPRRGRNVCDCLPVGNYHHHDWEYNVSERPQCHLAYLHESWVGYWDVPSFCNHRIHTRRQQSNVLFPTEDWAIRSLLQQ